MDKSCPSAGESYTSTTTGSNSNQYLKQLNKLSHKISKPPITTIPTIRKPPTIDPQVAPPSQSQQSQPPQPHQHQPPVYNINKNDFRDVVQKLTGSPSHSSSTPKTTAPTPPVLHSSRPPSSRLQRIRPPPLVHVSNRPPNLLNCAAPNPPLLNPAALVNPNPTECFIHRPPSAAPLSPLPPLPAVHAAAESPISAYMRYLHSSAASAFSEPNKQFSGFSPLSALVSPRWNNNAAPPQQPPPPQAAVDHQQPLAPPPTHGIPGFPLLPTSPLPFGCMNSPRSTASSSYPLLSPGLLLSPSSLPLSPTVQVPSPKWRGL